MIASRDRRSELLKTIASCREQTYSNKEIHVVDDASSDGTFEAVRSEYPDVVLTRNERPLGSVASRNLIFERATGDVLIGFDDDSRFVNSDSTARIVDRFRAETDLGLVDFQDIGPEYPERIPENSTHRLKGERPVSSFGAGRYAIRRTVLERTGLFPGFFWHSFEEPDLAIRIWDRGFRCIGWYDILVWHEWTGLNRNEKRTHQLHARNEILSALMRAPLVMIPPLILWRVVAQMRYSIKRGWWADEPRVWLDALKMSSQALRDRRPVRIGTLRRCLLMNRV